MMKAPTGEKQIWKDGSWLVNDSPDLITHLATEGFIESIQDIRREGYGFVPFVGAGFSAPSGAPLVTELKAYLQRCICMTLGAEDKDMEAWDPRTDQWPPFLDRNSTGKIISTPEYWAKKIRDGLPNLKDPEFPVFAEGWGATAEWRTALLFLSRLVRPPRGAGDKRRQPVSLAAPQQEIIDSCLREVLKEKYPALGHKMLAVLAGALRLDLVLTTNFDDLLERAFAGARNPLEVFEVHLGSGLPHWSAVSDVRSLIKLHGNRYSLRADYSLDELPSESDKKRFLEYLLSGKGRSELARTPKATGLDFQNHLLIMGFSVSDRRTCAFIEYAWQRLHKDFRVFWLCYAEEDVRQIKNFTSEFIKDQNDRTSLEPRHSIILRHTDFGFFLLQLYQAIRKNLPPLGSLFPSVSRLTLPPMPSSFVNKQAASEGGNSFYDEILKHLEAFSAPDFGSPKLVVATSTDNVRGVTSACSEVYRKKEAEHNICLWMDMNDISSTDNLFEVLLEAAYFRLGLENWTPVYIASDARPRADEIRRLVSSVAKPWVIFLNARETPGVNTTDGNAIRPNGWLDDSKTSIHPNAGDRTACMEEFLELLGELCGNKSQDVSVVLMCRHSTTEPSPIIEKLKNQRQSIRFVELNQDSKGKVSFSEETVTARAIAWTAGDKHKQRFLHALVLMQRPRLLATIWSSAVSLSDAQPSGTFDERQKWVNELEETGLLRRKAGGFIWIHSRCRQFIRTRLGDSEKLGKFLADNPEAQAAWGDWNPKIQEPEIHGLLAEWYGKVLDASESPAAVFEAVYHLCRAAETSLDLNNGNTELACERLEAAAALLKVNSFLIQTHGYSRGSCRHLEYIRDTLCKSIRKGLKPIPPELFNATQRLRIVCTEVMRMIAREVGEDAKLYRRHRQLGIFLAGDEWTEELEEQCKNKSYHISEELHKKLLAFETPGDGGNSKAVAVGNYINNSNSEWLRWWRWSGMLGIASRSFPVAKRSLKKALLYATPIDDGVPATTDDINWECLKRGEFMIFGRRPRGPQLQGIRVEVLRIMEQYVELSLLEEGLTSRLNSLQESGGFDLASEIQSDSPENALNRLKTIEYHIACGQKLAAEIRGRDHSSDSRSTILANWCEGRLLMHLSICAARRVQLDFGNEQAVLQNGMALLGDAEAGLRISDPRRNRSELSMIELHRAEVRMQQAESVQIYEGVDHTPMSFAQLCRTLELRKLKDSWGEQGEDLRIAFLGEGDKWAPRIEKALRRAKSLATDSMRFLNRAEPVLRDRRRNVWWTTWFFERRLRAIAMSVWASVFEINTPIPFLGLEAAMRTTDTMADMLLEDAIRMIRVDAYRLATIMDAYASCAKALQTRLILDKKTVRLPKRQESMYQALIKAVRALEDVEKRRNTLDSKEWKTDGCMDKNVELYVKAVWQRTEIIAEQVRYPN